MYTSYMSIAYRGLSQDIYATYYWIFGVFKQLLVDILTKVEL